MQEFEEFMNLIDELKIQGVEIPVVSAGLVVELIK